MDTNFIDRTNAITLTEQQQEALVSLKRVFPFRIIYGAVKGEEYKQGAVYTKHAPQRLARQGWTVYIIQ